MAQYKELEKNKFHITAAKTGNVAMHGHEFLEFSYLWNGEMDHNIDGNFSTVKEGDYFIVDHGTRHAYRSKTCDSLRVINFLFYPEFVERTLVGQKNFDEVLNSYFLRFSYKTLSSSPTGRTFCDEDGKIREIIKKIMLEYEEKKSGYIEYIRCMFLEILILTIRKIGNTEYKTDKSDVVIKITEYINNHYAEKIKLSDLADAYNYSLSHISKKFTEETGVGFTEYLQDMRIEQSCRLLESTNMKIGEIAAAVGYDSIKFFNKVFKEKLNLTPREFRKFHK